MLVRSDVLIPPNYVLKTLILAGATDCLTLQKKNPCGVQDCGRQLMEAWWGWAVSLAMVLIIIVYLSWPAWKLQHIPCPPYMWGVGHLPLMMKEKAQVFVRLAREYGPIYRYVVLLWDF
jgi:hypothetical protein